jgi:YegS/Rv2252/BmrU family lipid kinase
LANTKKTSHPNNGNNPLPLVIVNPKSAGGSTETRWANIASDLAAHFGAFKVAFTRSPGDGIYKAFEAAKNGQKFIIACGGDGTINEIANGILESGQDAEMGILPSGTGGDFRRTLNMPNTARAAAKGLRLGTTKMIDVGRVTFFNHENIQASRYFLNVSSFGLSASINERVKTKNSFAWLPGDVLRGKAKFALSTLQEVFDADFTTVRVRIDGADEKILNTINFCVANSRFFGGGMKIAPDAKLDDGFFDVVNIGDIRTAKILFNAYRLYDGSHLSLSEVKHKNAKRIEVRPANERETIYLETDGELPGKLPAIYEIIPHALKVRVPKQA